MRNRMTVGEDRYQWADVNIDKVRHDDVAEWGVGRESSAAGPVTRNGAPFATYLHDADARQFSLETPVADVLVETY